MPQVKPFCSDYTCPVQAMKSLRHGQKIVALRL